VITTGSKFFGTDQRLYIKCQGCLFIGFIKVGKKHLFIYDELGQIKEMNPLCVLDFYTYEGCQRKGYGKEIFTAMLQCERIEPRKLGYDRPSFKFLNFLKKY
jgi:alpha-tubulin N-acetyltransferase 1